MGWDGERFHEIEHLKIGPEGGPDQQSACRLTDADHEELQAA
jgi:hypothetical protein